MDNSFFSKSALRGPTPFRYSMGLVNILAEEIMNNLSKNKTN
jgi:hypothetical protein